MKYYSDKNELLKHLKKAMVELIDNTLGSDMEWRLDNFEEAKRKEGRGNQRHIGNDKLFQRDV